MELKRVKCIISYDGSNFNGFQIQKDARSVQEEIQLALFKIHKENINVVGSGRTDKGVHALGQVINFDTFLNLNENEWTKALNSYLPEDIHVMNSTFVDSSFHSRISAKEKTYAYYLNVGEYNPIKRNYVYQYNRYLYLDRMQEACKLFIGHHDFRNFCSNSIEEMESFERDIYSFEITQDKDLICFRVRGNGFMRYMVRMMVGNLIEIGSKRKDKSEISNRLDKKERQVTSFNAPSCGLYLEEVKY